MTPETALPWGLFLIAWGLCALTMFFWNKTIREFHDLNEEWFKLASEQEDLIKELLEKLKPKP